MSELTKFAFALARVHAAEITGNPQFLEKPMQRDDQAAELFDAADQEYEHQVQIDREQELYDALNECAAKGISKESLRVLARESGGTTWALQQSLKG